MPPLDNRDTVEMNVNESKNVDVCVAAVSYETLDDGSITSIPEQPEQSAQMCPKGMIMMMGVVVTVK